MQAKQLDDYVVYEYPLNQKIRSYLRLEQYFQLIDFSNSQNNQLANQSTLAYLIELTEYLYRSDFKGDLLRELDKNIQFFSKHSQDPDIDTNKLSALLLQFKRHYAWLSQQQGRIGANLLQDPFILQLKQRLNGGICTVTDLPLLNYWLHQSADQRHSDISNWYRDYTNVKEIVQLLFGIKRDPSFFQSVKFANGFLQMESGQASLFRIAIPKSLSFIPEVSVGGPRISVHLKLRDKSRQPSSPPPEDIHVAICY